MIEQAIRRARRARFQRGRSSPRPRIRDGARSVVVCPRCWVVLRDGRWSWGIPRQARARASHCPACQRIRRLRPAGILRIPRALFEPDPAAVLALVRQAELQEMEAFPLERVMSVHADRHGFAVATTGVYLAGVITGMLERKLQLRPRIRYSSGQVGVEWEDPASGGEARPART